MNKPQIIGELKKNDRFKFGPYTYLVTKKYRNDDSPLVALREDDNSSDNLFHNEELEVIKIDRK